MATWKPYLSLETELKNLETAISSGDNSVDIMVRRAITLNALGRSDDAKKAYLEILKIEPGNFDALNNLGALLMNTGHRTFARKAYEEVVKYHPNNHIGLINLANAFTRDNEPELAIKYFRDALKSSPDNPEAHQGLSYLLGDIGDEKNAEIHRRKGFKNQPIMILPYKGQGVPIAVLMLASAKGNAVPFKHHLSDKLFFTSIVFVEYYNKSFPFPPHHLVFNAIGDADLGVEALDAAEKVLQYTNAPVINHPAKIKATGRAQNAKNLSGIPGVITPKIALVPREKLSAEKISATLSEYVFKFPFLLRPPGFHTGKFFEKIDDEAQLANALTSLPGDELLMIEYIDTRDSHSKTRKYRVMMIGGKLYPLHAAISENWKVHYFSADMENNAAHRKEDEAFLNDMQAVIGKRAVKSLEDICKTLGLDYGGIDFGINAGGEVVLYETNATMFVNHPAAGAQWDYRRAPTQHILDAVRALLTGRAQKELVTVKP